MRDHSPKFPFERRRDEMEVFALIAISIFFAAIAINVFLLIYFILKI